MILEGLVTTLGADSQPHLAPMGPHVEGPEFQRFYLKPYRSSQTYANLRNHREGVLHVTDDALLIARSAIGPVEPFPMFRPAEQVCGVILADCVRWLEFRVIEIDESADRVTMAAEVVACGQGRPWFGFNRGRHAVIEAAILATRVHLIPRTTIESQMDALDVIVTKTGGPDELLAMRLLRDHVSANR